MTVELASGVLLISDPKLTDPNFDCTVVLLCVHAEQGSMGLVLNRPTDAKLNRILTEPGPFEGLELPVDWGGPVGLNQLQILVGDLPPGGNSLQVLEGVHLWKGSDLDELAGIHSSGHPMRFLVGYSGWDAGQLESEMSEDAWRLVPATADTVFDLKPEDLWLRIITEQDPGLSWMRNLPPDPWQE